MQLPDAPRRLILSLLLETRDVESGKPLKTIYWKSGPISSLSTELLDCVQRVSAEGTRLAVEEGLKEMK